MELKLLLAKVIVVQHMLNLIQEFVQVSKFMEDLLNKFVQLLIVFVKKLIHLV